MATGYVETMSLSSVSESGEELEERNSPQPQPDAIVVDALSDNEDFKSALVYASEKADISLCDESETCSICFESWTTSGPHRISCLRCGHLFGRSCVMRWLHSQKRLGKCPQCNARAHPRDVRVLFCKKIRAIDTTDRDRALADLETERKLRRKTELELSEMKFKCQLASNDADNLRDELKSIKAVLTATQSSSLPLSTLTSDSAFPSGFKSIQTVSAGSYELLRSMLLSPTGHCRVIAACDYISILCASQPSINPLFKGFGFRKIHTGELRPLKYIHLHSQPIRDLALHPDQQDGIVASASVDKSVKLTSLLVDQVVQTYQCPSPAWSCCWSSPSPYKLFVGCANGSVLLFDVRVTSGPVETISLDSNSSPVTALQYLPTDYDKSACPLGGLLVGQLTQVSFLEEKNDPASGGDNGSSNSTSCTYRIHPLPMEGSLVSLSSVPRLRLVLASYRPSQRIPRVRHLFGELVSLRAAAGEEATFDCQEVASLYGGSQMRMLSRACLFQQASSERVFAASGDDDAGGALLWNCNTGSRFQTLLPPTTNGSQLSVLDMCAFNEGNRLALLTDRQIHLYQWSGIASTT